MTVCDRRSPSPVAVPPRAARSGNSSRASAHRLDFLCRVRGIRRQAQSSIYIRKSYLRVLNELYTTRLRCERKGAIDERNTLDNSNFTVRIKRQKTRRYSIRQTIRLHEGRNNHRKKKEGGKEEGRRKIHRKSSIIPSTRKGRAAAARDRVGSAIIGSRRRPEAERTARDASATFERLRRFPSLLAPAPAANFVAYVFRPLCERVHASVCLACLSAAISRCSFGPSRLVSIPRVTLVFRAFLGAVHGSVVRRIRRRFAYCSSLHIESETDAS